ncbi:MAG: replication-associated recombination protein A [Thermoanaerobaculia bacterium]|nr:replication-associated recombination protein A [Thermoanaerobaculia bacterium]
MAASLFDDLPDPAAAFDEAAAPAEAPLAERMRPRSLDEVVGHETLVGEDGVLRRSIAADRVPSLIFWGPPGCGKTTLARILAAATSCRFVPFSAVTSGIKEVRVVMEEAGRLRRAQGVGTLLFVDEIHRFNRAQQDAFLPYMESGEIVLVGATTENPAFELNAALLSRCRVAILEGISAAEIEKLLRRALADSERGLGAGGVTCEAEVVEAIAAAASGDARRALNQLELVVEDAQRRGGGEVSIDDLGRLLQRQPLRYDKRGEQHFDQISAFHKSLRDSDPDAAVYWLTRMLDAGEDPLYLARRMVRVASEDIGLADPQALPQALAAWDAFQRLGSPEGELALVQAALYLALAPSSDATYLAAKAAQAAVAEHGALPVPMALRNAPTDLQRRAGYGQGYVHAHDQPDGVGGMQCLPDALRDEKFYQPKPRGNESDLAIHLERLRKRRGRDS